MIEDEVLRRVEGVSKSYGDIRACDNVSFELWPGEVLGIVGESGSGKTTLLSLLAGLDSPSEGTIVLGGDQDITVMSEAQRAKLRGEMVGFVFQTFQLLSSLTALENVMLPGELRSDPQAEDNAKKLLDRVGLGHRLQHYPRQLSGGEQQRVAIARAFASNPKILFADEPTGNLDAKTGAKIIDLLFDLNADFGTTLVLVTHDARLASRCERSILIEAGQLVSEVLETSAATA